MRKRRLLVSLNHQKQSGTGERSVRLSIEDDDSLNIILDATFTPDEYAALMSGSAVTVEASTWYRPPLAIKPST